MVDSPSPLTLPPCSNMTQDGEKKLAFYCSSLSVTEIKFSIIVNPSLTHYTKFGTLWLDIYHFWGSKSKPAKRCRQFARGSKIATLHCRQHRNVHKGTCTSIFLFPSLYLLNSLFCCPRRTKSEHSKAQLYSISVIYEVMTVRKSQNKSSRDEGFWAFGKQKWKKERSHHTPNTLTIYEEYRGKSDITWKKLTRLLS